MIVLLPAGFVKNVLKRSFISINYLFPCVFPHQRTKLRLVQRHQTVLFTIARKFTI